MKKLSLAVFNTQPPHLYFGGVERRILETAKRLYGDANTTIYSGTKAGFRTPASVCGAHIIPCFSTDVLFPMDNWFFNKTLASMVDKIQADVYEAHVVSGYGYLRALRKRRINKPFIQTVHGVLADEYDQLLRTGSLTLRAKMANLLMQQLSNLEMESARNATLVVTVSKYSARRIGQFYGIDKEKIHVVPNGVDTQRFKPSEDCKLLLHRIGLDSKFCVLFVGRLIPRKGLNYLVEAASLIVKEYSQTTFLIVGNGPQKRQMVSAVEKRNMARNFVFLGDVSESVLPVLYNCADIFVLPSIQEGQGIALLEAQASGKPVVAFDVGGVPEAVLTGRTGLLVEPDSSKLADATMKLLASWTLRKKMGDMGRKFVTKNFSWDSCAQKMLSVYRAALSADS
jgi:glycosyltransferase involved in cell wall biosynthesis